MSSYFDTFDIDPNVVYMVAGGALAGACVSQVLYSSVRVIPVALGACGGAVWYQSKETGPRKKKTGKFLNDKRK